jgi:hypothetical protein
MTTGQATAWMRDAVCTRRPDLPWTADAVQVGTWDRLTMTVLCERCPVHTPCVSYADAVQADGGFWAGAHRDIDTDPLTAVVAGGPPWVASSLPGLETLDGAA